MNRLPLETRAFIIKCLCEGMSIRSTSRLTGVARNTVSKLLVDAGRAASVYQDEVFRDLSCKDLEADEIWSFVHARRYTPTTNPEAGDVWTWVAICAESRLVPAWWVGDRTNETGYDFMLDLDKRFLNEYRLVTDQWQAYEPAAEKIPRINHVQVVDKRSSDVNTNHIERLNGTMRLSIKRFHRATYAFSKKLENHMHAVALFFMHYNFCHWHNTFRETPAMAEGLEDRRWEAMDIAKLLGSN